MDRPVAGLMTVAALVGFLTVPGAVARARVAAGAVARARVAAGAVAFLTMMGFL